MKALRRSGDKDDLPLFRRVFHPDQRSVFFVGLLQPLGAVMPLASFSSSRGASLRIR